MASLRVSYIPSTILTTSTNALAGSNGAVTFLNVPRDGQPSTLSSTATFKMALPRSSVASQGSQLTSININYSIEDNNINSVTTSLSTQAFGPASSITLIPTTPSGFTLTPGNYTGVVTVNSPAYANGINPEYYLLTITTVVSTAAITELRVNDIELVYTGGTNASSITGWSSLVSGDMSIGDSSLAVTTNSTLTTAAGENTLTNTGLTALPSTTMTATFVQPDINTSVNVSVVSSASFATNMIVNIPGGGYYAISGVPDGVTLSLIAFVYSGNAAIGATVGINTVTQVVIADTGVGSRVLTANTFGSGNTGFGANALTSNTTGYHDTAIGVNALYSNTTGINNTAIGANSLFSNTTGSNNLALGKNALLLNTTGTTNTALGTNSLARNTTATNNTGVGMNAIRDTTTGGNNTAVGVNGLLVNTTGTGNTAVGVNALSSNTTGINNIAVGITALLANTTGSNNSALGRNALAANTTGINNTAVGINALNTSLTGDNNTALGINAGSLVTSAAQCTIIGSNADVTSGTETYSTALGWGAVITANNQLVLGSTNLSQGILRVVMPLAAAPVSAAFGAANTANGALGVLTYKTSTAAATSATTTVTNSSVTTSSRIWLTIASYSGTWVTNGYPQVSVDSTANGSFVLRLTNMHAANALTGTLTINFWIIN